MDEWRPPSKLSMFLHVKPNGHCDTPGFVRVVSTGDHGQAIDRADVLSLRDWLTAWLEAMP